MKENVTLFSLLLMVFFSFNIHGLNQSKSQSSGSVKENFLIIIFREKHFICGFELSVLILYLSK